MIALNSLLAAVALQCSSGTQNWTDVTAFADPVLTQLAVEFAATALQKQPTEFSYYNVAISGKSMMAQLSYVDHSRVRFFTVLINTETWERSYFPSE